MPKFIVPAALMVALCPAVRSLANDFTTINAKVGTTDWIVQESTGRIFSSLTTEDFVVEHNAEGHELRRFAVGGGPEELLIKSDYLAVGCKKFVGFSVIDLNTNKVVGSVSLEGKGPYGLFCSQVDNSYVYGVCDTGGASSAGEVFQVDIEKLSVRKRVPLKRPGQKKPIHVVMSRNGKWIVFDAQVHTNPSGANLMKVDEEECTFLQIRDHDRGYGQMVAGPANRYWTFGEHLYSLDIETAVRSFQGSPVAIHPRLNLATSYTGVRVVLQRFSDAKELKHYRVGAGLHGLGVDPTLQYDLANDRIIFAHKTKGFVIDLTKVGVEFEPMLMVAAPPAVAVRVGEPLRMPIALTNEELEQDTSFDLASAPPGVQLVDGALRWTPDRGQIGPHDIKITATRGSALDLVRIKVTVNAPKTEVGFRIRDMAVGPAGKIVAVWGNPITQGPYASSRLGREQLALIDLDSEQVIVQRPLAAGVRTAMLDDEYIFLAPHSGNVLYRLDRANLGGDKRVFLPGNVLRFAPVATGRCGVITQKDHRPVLSVYDRATMKKIGEEQLGRIAHGMSPYMPRGGSHVEAMGKVIDRKTGAFVCLTSAYQKFPIPATDDRNRAVFQNRFNNLPKLWGRRLSGNSLVNNSTRPIAFWNATLTKFSNQFPLAVSVRKDNQNGLNRWLLDYRELVEGKLIESTVIDVDSSGSSGFKLEIVGRRVIIAYNNKVLTSEIPADVIKEATAPLHLPLPTRTIFSTDKPVSLQLTAVSGRGSISYGLAAEYPGLTLDESTGKLTIDLPSMWESFLKTMSDFRYRENATTLLKANSENFQALVGKPLPEGKVALAVPILASAVDEEGQQDEVFFSVIALGPKAEVDEYKKQLAEAQAKAREAALERQRQLAAQRAEREEAKSDIPSDRLDQIEKRIRRIEAAVDAILERLDKVQPADKTKPVAAPTREK